MSTCSTSQASKLPTLGDDEVEALYAYGYSFFRLKQYRKALDFLTVAMLFRPTNLNYLVAVGLAHRMLDERVSALQAFKLASLLHPTRPEPLVHLADCAWLIGWSDQAIEAARAALACPAGGDAVADELRQRAQMMVKVGGEARPAPSAALQVLQ